MAGSLGDLFVTVGAKLDNFKQGMKEVGAGLDETVEHSKHTAEGISKAFSGVGAGMLEMLGAAGLIVGIVEIGETFEQAAFKIQQATGATGHELHGMEEAFKDIYITSAASAENIVAAMTTISRKTGATGEELEGLTKSALKFAKVTGTDVVSSVALNEKVFASWGVEVEQQSAHLDVMYVATQKTGIGADVLSEALLSMGPTLRNLRYDFLESTALIASFEKAGLNATDMTMGMSKVFVAFAQAGKEPKQAFLDLIEKMSETETRVQALNLAIEAGFNAKTAGRFVDAVKSGAFGLKDLIEMLTKSGGAVDKMADKTQTLGGAWTKLGHAMSALLEKPGVALIGMLGDVTQAMADLAAGVVRGTFAWVDYWEAAKGFLAGGAGIAAMKFAESAAKRNAALPAAASTAHAPLDVAGAEGGGAGGGGASPAVTDKYRPFKDTSDSVAVFIAMERQAISVHQSLIDEIAKSGQTITGYFQKNVIQATVALGDFKLGIDKLVVSMVDAVFPPKKLSETMDELAAAMLKAQQAALDLSPYKALEDGMKELGLTSSFEYQKMADNAVASFDKILKSGLATDDDLAIAALTTAQIEIDADLHAGRIRREDYAITSAQIQADLAKLTGAHVAAGRTTSQVWQQVESVFKSVGSSIADVIVDGKSLADAFKDIGKQILKVLITDVVEYGFGKLLTAIASSSSALGQLGAKLGGIFSGGGGVASSAGGAASSGVGGAGSAVAGVAGSAVTGIVGAVAGVVGAVSSIIGNFQMAGMNKSLDIIVKHTLQTANDLANLRADSWARETHLMLKLDDLWNSIRDITTTLRGGNLSGYAGAGSGGGGVTFNFNNVSFSGTSQAAVTEMFGVALREAKASGDI